MISIPKQKKKKRSEMSFAELLELKKERKKLRTKKKREAHREGNFSNSEMERLADDIFSLYIRLRDCNSDLMVQCCTCPNVLPIKGIQNGHLESRTFDLLRYDPMNCDSQCVGCNHKNWGNGRYAEHAQWIAEKRGIEAIDYINRIKRAYLAKELFPEPPALLHRRVIEEYTPIVEELAEKLGFTIEGTHKTLLNKARKIIQL